ncbi:hypothetical protein ACFE04_005178 [Oxalis oulophora]
MHQTILHFESFIEKVDIQWAPEMATGNNDIVVVTISHPPLPRVSRKTKSNFNKYVEHPRMERVVELRSNSDHSLRLRECCKKEIYTEALFCMLCQAVTTFLDLCCRYSLPALTVYYILTALIISSKNCLLKNKEGNILIVMVGSEVPTNLSGTTSGISSRVQLDITYPYLYVPQLLITPSTDLKMSRPTVKSRANCKTLYWLIRVVVTIVQRGIVKLDFRQR